MPVAHGPSSRSNRVSFAKADSGLMERQTTNPLAPDSPLATAANNKCSTFSLASSDHPTGKLHDPQGRLSLPEPETFPQSPERARQPVSSAQTPLTHLSGRVGWNLSHDRMVTKQVRHLLDLK